MSLRLYAALVPSAAAVLAWAAFSPGLLSPDSIHQLTQALTWSFDDWHPPFPAVMAGIVLGAGIPVSGLLLLQAIAWSASTILLFVSGSSSPTPARQEARRPAASILAIAALLALFLFSFLPPWPLYAVTFWKDCWTAIALMGLVAALRTLAHRHGRSFSRTLAAAAVGAAIVAALTRHNAGILLLPAAVASALVEARWPGRARVLRVATALLLPFLLWGAVRTALPRLVPIAPSPIGTVVLAHELAIALHADPALASSLPYAEQAVARHYNPGTARGNLAALVARTWWLGPNLGATLDRERIRAEYLTLLAARPGLVLELKLRSWLQLFYAAGTGFWIQEIIEPNELGLAWGPELSGVREVWLEGAFALRQSPLRLFVTSHAPWLLAGLALFLLEAVRARRRRDAESLFALLAAATPLLYAASFIVAYAVPDYRYLYPATLAVQATLIGRLISAVQAAKRDVAVNPEADPAP